MNIQSLLNPPSGGSRQNRDVEPQHPPAAPYYATHDTGARRQRLAKDAPVFSEGVKIVGHVNYPPHEAGSDRDLLARHHEFRVFPLGEIVKKGVRRIPYFSKKKHFHDKTGRDAFEGRRDSLRVISIL